MAIWGELVFYTLHEPEDPKEWILQLCRLSGAQSVKSVSYLEEEERWFKTLEDWELIENDVEKVGAIIVVSPFPTLAENIPSEEVTKILQCQGMPSY